MRWARSPVAPNSSRVETVLRVMLTPWPGGTRYRELWRRRRAAATYRAARRIAKPASASSCRTIVPAALAILRVSEGSRRLASAVEQLPKLLQFPIVIAAEWQEIEQRGVTR